jgi:hypothetical protein
MFKRLWLIWSRTVDHRIGKTDDDKPDIPILKNKDANISLLIRTVIIIVNLITCFFIIANTIRRNRQIKVENHQAELYNK